MFWAGRNSDVWCRFKCKHSEDNMVDVFRKQLTCYKENVSSMSSSKMIHFGDAPVTCVMIVKCKGPNVMLSVTWRRHPCCLPKWSTFGHLPLPRMGSMIVKCEGPKMLLSVTSRQHGCCLSKLKNFNLIICICLVNDRSLHPRLPRHRPKTTCWALSK